MAGIRYLIIAVSISFGSIKAWSTPQDYCAAYARDFADQGARDQWQSRNANALKDCLFVTAPAVAPAQKKVKRPKLAKIEKPKQPSKPVVKPAALPKTKQSKPILQVGSVEWLNYCDKKYASFDRATGNYKSFTGIERKCLVTAE